MGRGSPKVPGLSLLVEGRPNSRIPREPFTDVCKDPRVHCPGSDRFFRGWSVLGGVGVGGNMRFEGVVRFIHSSGTDGPGPRGYSGSGVPLVSIPDP